MPRRLTDVQSRLLTLLAKPCAIRKMQLAPYERRVIDQLERRGLVSFRTWGDEDERYRWHITPLGVIAIGTPSQDGKQRPTA